MEVPWGIYLRRSDVFDFSCPFFLSVSASSYERFAHDGLVVPKGLKPPPGGAYVIGSWGVFCSNHMCVPYSQVPCHVFLLGV